MMLLPAMLMACGEAASVLPAAVASIDVEAPRTEFLVGEEHRYTAVARSADGAVLPTPLTWESTNASVATISPTGRLSALASGTTQIVAAGGGRSSRFTIRVTMPNAVPVLETLTPLSVRADVNSTFDIVALGTHFSPTSVIRLNGSPRQTAFVSSSELRMTAASSEADVTGTLAVSVFTPAPGGGESATRHISIVQPEPQVDALVPARIVQGWALPLTVEVRGSGFTRASRLTVDDVDRVIDVVQPSVLRFRLRPDELQTARTIGVRIANPAPGGGVATASLAVEAVPVASVHITSPYGVAWTWAGLSLPLAGVPRSATNVELLDRAITWRIASTAIGSLTPTGILGVSLLGINPGNTTVRATVEGVEANAEISVYPTPAYDVLFSGGLLGDRYIARWHTGSSRVPVRLPLGMEAMHPAPSPDGTRFAFSGIRPGGEIELYVADADGRNVQRLTSDVHNDLYPVWSPDGSQIAFTSVRQGGLNVYTIRPDGTLLVQHTWASATDPLPGSGNAASKPAWSPDGRQLVYAVSLNGRSSLWIMNANGSDKRQLTAPQNADDFDASWSADGRTIVFRRVSRATLAVSVMHVNAATGAELPTAFSSALRQLADPQFSADGEWLMFAAEGEVHSPALYAIPARAYARGLRLVLPSYFPGGVRDARWIRRLPGSVP